MKSKTVLIGFVISALVLGYATLYYFFRQTSFIRPELTVCTQEAKQCSDGSYVGRTGPQCAFAPCPESTIDASWKTFIDDKRGISFRYPETLGAMYVRAHDWPPQPQVINEPFSCIEAGRAMARAGKTELRRVDGRTYCVTTIVEGAAGSIYTQYAYAVDKSPQTWIFTATTRATQCGNYSEPQKTACEREQETFDFDSIMDRIIQTTVINR